MNRYAQLLDSGQHVEFRPRGHSMTPLIRSGQLVHLEPANTITDGDIVLARVHGCLYLHLVTAIADNRIQISNNHGHINGWTSPDRVYGRVTTIDGISFQPTRH